MNAKRHAAVLLLLLGALVPSAAQSVPRAPAVNEVVIAGRVVVTPEIDTEFFTALALRTGIKKTRVGPNELSLSVTPKSDKRLKVTKRVATDEPGALTLAKVRLPQSKTLVLESFRLDICGAANFYLYLPVRREIVVPENANFVYIGTLRYELTGRYFEIANTSISDEYDGALEAVRGHYGADTTLHRVQLIEVSQ